MEGYRNEASKGSKSRLSSSKGGTLRFPDSAGKHLSGAFVSLISSENQQGQGSKYSTSVTTHPFVWRFT